MKRLILCCICTVNIIIFYPSQAQNSKKTMKDTSKPAVTYSEEELKKRLSPEQYNVCIGKGTERAFTGKYWNHKADGIYTCAVCHEPLFDSQTKYDSGSGWPSFYQALEKSKIKEEEDLSHGMRRIEIMCKKCGSHLGHVFPDGPKPTGLRYCVNSASLEFVERKK